MTSSEISLQFIEALREAQYVLQCEWSMNRVETTYRMQQYDQMLVTFLNSLALQKRHYMLIYLLLASSRTPDSSVPRYWESIHATVPAEFSQKPYPPITGIFSKLPRCNDQDLADALTFGAIPPYFSFFMTDFGIRLFIDLLDMYADDPPLYDCYARMAFASPLFITFASEVFQPIISPLLPDRPLPTLEMLSSQILERWRGALATMPPVVSRLLERASNPKRTLSQSFFDVALQRERAKIFGMIDFSRMLTDELVDLLRVLLTVASRLNILAELVEMTRAGVPSKFTLFTEDDRETVPALFQPVLLSTFDFNACSALQLPDAQFVHPTEYEVRAYLHTGEQEASSIHNAPDPTMTIDHLRVEAAMRHLLQDADPIPQFKIVPTGLTIERFFVDYLLRRGPRGTFSCRYDNLTTIRWKSVFFSNENEIRSALSRTTLERKKEIRALSAFTVMWETFSLISKETQLAREAVQKLFSWLPVFSWCSRHVHTPLPAYVRNPSALVTDFVELQESWAADRLLPTPQPELLYAFLTRHLSFEAFRKSLPRIQALDGELTGLFRDAGNRLCDELFPVAASHGQWNISQWMRERVNRLRSCPDALDILCVAAVESSPIRKLQEFGRAFQIMRKDVLQSAPPSKEIGEDELLPAQIGFVIVANPPALASNLAFICEFCGPSQYDQLFRNSLIQPLSILKLICRYLKDTQALIDMGYL
jgi:hypothetical protein